MCFLAADGFNLNNLIEYDHHDLQNLENVLIVLDQIDHVVIVQEVIDRNAMANLNRDALAKMAKNVHFPAQIDQIAIRAARVIVQVLNRDLRDLAIVH